MYYIKTTTLKPYNRLSRIKNNFSSEVESLFKRHPIIPNITSELDEASQSNIFNFFGLTRIFILTQVLIIKQEKMGTFLPIHI